MKTLLNLSVVTLLCMASTSQCLGMIMLEDVSKKRAEELGVTVRTNSNGQAGIRVLMEFKTKGELQKVTYVELQVGEGEDRIVSAPLLVSNSDSGSASVNFSAFPSYLPKCTLMIVAYDGRKGGVGYRFKLKDFIEPKNTR